MPKKEKIVIQRDDSLKSIDDELDAALGRLDGANDRISTLLQAMDQNQPIAIPDNIVADWHDETSVPRSESNGDEEE
ncbi:MAG TPA: hypothetical protein PLJ47_09760 [Candidatus Hydrogenedentes bacterium]|nr:hypothetical protein [Candidatus Hydrogenedentota bacterium]HRK34865.1 hypothetical protein [Candidatus Hydrogenedentota bacterium]